MNKTIKLLERIRITSIILSIVLYILSLYQVAFYTAENNDFASYGLLLIGAIAFLGGGVYEPSFG